jgi:hypothetical protein
MFYRDSEDAIELIDELQNYLKIYVSLCEV